MLVLIISIVFLSSCGPAVITQNAPATAESNSQQPITEVASNKTKTGFYWPTGTENWGNYFGWWADGCSSKEGYFQGSYHIGWDIKANSGDKVYAISDGKVIYVSKNNWGDGNYGVLIQHYLADRSPFIALYGHVRYSLNIGDIVIGKEQIAVIGPFIDKGQRADHLHFGIIPGENFPSNHLGSMTCPQSGTNGFENPLKWITTNYPGVMPTLVQTAAPTRQLTSTLIPAPVPTPIRRITQTKTSSPSVSLDQKDQKAVIKYILKILKDKQPQLIEKFVGNYGTALGYGYGTEYYPPGHNNLPDVIKELSKAVKNASPTCHGYEEVNEGNGISKMSVYIKGLSCKDSGFCDYQQGESIFYFIFNKFPDGNWYLVAIGPVQKPLDEYLTNLNKCQN